MNPAFQVEPLQPGARESRPLPSVGDWTQILRIRAWSVLKWMVQRAGAQPTRKNLRVCESVLLGEKRFVAVVQVDKERFLIGGSSSSVSLLTRLPELTSPAADLQPE